MTGFIFENWPTSHWTNKDWAKMKQEEAQKKNLMLIDDYFPGVSNRIKAKKCGFSYVWYLQLRRKFNLNERRLK